MNKQILVLKTERLDFDEEMITKLNNEGNKDNVSYKLSYYKNIDMFIDKNVKVIIDQNPLENYSLIYFKSWNKQKYLASVIAQIAFYNKIPLFDKTVLMQNSGHKLFQTTLLALNKLPVPKSYYTNRHDLSYQEVVSYLGETFIAKACFAREGNKNYLVHNFNEFEQLRDEFTQEDFLFQEFISNDCDYRCVILGEETRYIKRRSRKDKNTHKNNVFLGAEVEYLDIDQFPELTNLSKKAAEVFNIQIAGVDIVVSNLNQELYVLEVNKSPAFRHDLSVMKYLHKFFKSQL